MNVKWREKSISEKILCIISGIFILIAFVFFFLNLMQLWEHALNVFWVLLCISNILLRCANWKSQPVLSSVMIGMWSFMLGAFVTLAFI